MCYFSAIGQDSHRFDEENPDKPLILGGVHISGVPGLLGNSDADVILHAICNALSGLSGMNILGSFTDRLCNEQGITDSRVYVKEALATLGEIHLKHISITIEASRPHFAEHIETIRNSIASLLHLIPSHIGITATSGEGLTAFGRGEGIHVFVIASGFRNMEQK